MNKSTSPITPPSRKSKPAPVIPDEYLAARWSDAELLRLLALSTLGLAIFGTGWFFLRSFWTLFPAGLCALALQISATMIAARAAVASGGQESASGGRESAPGSRAPSRANAVSPWYAFLLAAPVADTPEATASEVPPTGVALPLQVIPAGAPAASDAALHRAFFRRVVEAEFREYTPGLVWPDLGSLQGSLATRLRLFRRHPSYEPLPASEISEHECTPHSPWHHLAAIDAATYRHDDAIARMSHRAFAPMAFLELHVRVDLPPAERAVLDEELGRLYTVGFGRILTPPSVLSAAEPLRLRLGGAEAIALADDARLAMRSTHRMEDAARVRREWRARSHSAQSAFGWPGEVSALVDALVDYWYVQRAAAEDMSWAEELTRLEGGTLGAALAQRDESGTFCFAEALRVVSGGSGRQEEAPTAAATVA